MKKVLKITLLIIVLLSMLVLTGCDKNKEEENKVGTNQSTAENSKYKWPELSQYDIPKFEKGKIVGYTDDSNIDGYLLNYEIRVEGIKEEDIEEYLSNFSEDWEMISGIGDYAVTKNVRNNKYSVVVEIDENNTIVFKISAL